MRIHYEIRPSSDLTTLTTRVCFPDGIPERFDAQMPAARWSLRAVRAQPGGQSLEQRVEGLDLSSLSAGDCLHMVLDLEKVASKLENEKNMRRIGPDWYISPDYWLWRPTDARPMQLTADIATPEGVTMSVPWPRLDDSARYLIPPSTFLWQVPGTLARSPLASFPVGQARVQVAILGDSWKISRADLLSWMRGAAEAVARMGGMPTRHVQVILLPAPTASIGFGFATHGGGSTVVIFVGTAATPEVLREDWVAVHELLHLNMPMMDAESRWLNEGLSTYLEPLLRAQAGLHTPAQAWEQLHDGFQRGSGQPSKQSLRKDCIDMHETRRYWRVYWAGAAILFRADLAARQAGHSLAEEVLRIRECCKQTLEVTSANALMARTTSAGTPMLPYLVAAATPRLDQVSFPELADVYRALGLSFDERGEVTLSRNPAQRALREQFTGPEDAPATPAP